MIKTSTTSGVIIPYMDAMVMSKASAYGGFTRNRKDMSSYLAEPVLVPDLRHVECDRSEHLDKENTFFYANGQQNVNIRRQCTQSLLKSTNVGSLQNPCPDIDFFDTIPRDKNKERWKQKYRESDTQQFKRATTKLRKSTNALMRKLFLLCFPYLPFILFIIYIIFTILTCTSYEQQFHPYICSICYTAKPRDPIYYRKDTNKDLKSVLGSMRKTEEKIERSIFVFKSEC